MRVRAHCAHAKVAVIQKVVAATCSVAVPHKLEPLKSTLPTRQSSYGKRRKAHRPGLSENGLFAERDKPKPVPVSASGCAHPAYSHRSKAALVGGLGQYPNG